MEDVLASKGREKSELITKMLDDEKYQREAFQVNFLQYLRRLYWTMAWSLLIFAKFC